MAELAVEKKKIVLSGIQPSGNQFTLGNYIGAIRNWANMQDEFNCIYMVANEHSITVRQEPAKLRENTYRALASLLAAGIDPEKSVLFIQTHVSAHAELAWILNCYTMYGELSRMTQFKDKSAKNADNINAGLFTYPVLMAADILLYQADLVPVGADQKQHVEIARDIANRFNGIYGNTFKLPEPYIPAIGAKIMSLAEPEKKMSKSDPNVNANILVMDKPEDIMRKFKRAVTDSQGEVRRGPDKPGINNLITIYSVATGKTPEQIEAEFAGKGYGDFKTAVGQAVIDELAPVQARYKELINDKKYLEECMRKGADLATRISQRTLDKVMRKVGFYQTK